MDWHNLCPCAPLALMTFKNYKSWNFPGCPVVKTLCFPCRGLSSIPAWGTKIPRAMGASQKKKIHVTCPAPLKTSGLFCSHSGPLPPTLPLTPGLKG